jgi:ABC-type dipeptide/oligopeptide/nickel transport system ATPase component
MGMWLRLSSSALCRLPHDLSVIRRLCSRIVVLQQGEIVENAPAVELFEEPKTDYTKELLAAIPLPDPDQEWL